MTKDQLKRLMGKVDEKIDELMAQKPTNLKEARKIQKSINIFNKTRDRYQKQILN